MSVRIPRVVYLIISVFCAVFFGIKFFGADFENDGFLEIVKGSGSFFCSMIVFFSLYWNKRQKESVNQNLR